MQRSSVSQAYEAPSVAAFALGPPCGQLRRPTTDQRSPRIRGGHGRSSHRHPNLTSAPRGFEGATGYPGAADVRRLGLPA